MNGNIIKRFAESQGFEDGVFEGMWKGYFVYGRVFKTEGPHYLGPPLKILVKGDEIRMSTAKEAMEYLRDIMPYEDDE